MAVSNGRGRRNEISRKVIPPQCRLESRGAPQRKARSGGSNGETGQSETIGKSHRAYDIAVSCDPQARRGQRARQPKARPSGKVIAPTMSLGVAGSPVAEAAERRVRTGEVDENEISRKSSPHNVAWCRGSLNGRRRAARSYGGSRRKRDDREKPSRAVPARHNVGVVERMARGSGPNGETIGDTLR